jgi:hypothetical protein
MAPWSQRGPVVRWIAMAGVLATAAALVAWQAPGRRLRDRAIERHAELAREFDRIAEQHLEAAGSMRVADESADPALRQIHRRIVEFSKELGRQARDNAEWHAQRARELARHLSYDDRRDGEADRLQEQLERGQRVWARVEGGLLDSEIRSYVQAPSRGGPRRAAGPSPASRIAGGPRAAIDRPDQRPSGEVSARATCLSPSNFDNASVRNLM